jgi:hypothetical protein
MHFERNAPILGHRKGLGLAVALLLLLSFGVAAVGVQHASAADGDVTLSPGWNLVGWAGETTPIDDALQAGGIIDRVSAVWGYDNGTWKAFFPAAADVPGANDLSTFEHLAGYFIAVNGTGAVVWHISSSSPGTPATSSATSTPTSTPTQPTTTPTPTQAPDTRVSAAHATYYTDSIGAVWVVGEVHNGLSVPVEFVEVTANFYLNGTLVGTENGYASLTAIPAGGSSPFTVLEVSPPSFDSVKYSVTDYDTDNFEPVIEGLDAAITNTSVDSIDYTHIVGTVTNNSAQTYQFVEVYVASYDTAGDVVAVDTTFAHPDTLTPGQTGTFEALSSPEEHAGSVVTRRVFVDANLP